MSEIKDKIISVEVFKAFFDLLDKGKASKDYVDGSVRKAAPRNLLDNGNFEIAQAGYGGYHGSLKYAADRWWCETNDVAISYENGVLTIDNSAQSMNGVVMQKIEQESAEMMYGKTYTLAVYDGDGNVKCNSGIIAETAGDGETMLIVDFGIFYVSTVFFKNSISYQTARITVSPGKVAKIKAICLYEGQYTSETLPEYQPKGYAVELMECQRYLVKIAEGGCDYAMTLLPSGEKTLELDVYLPIEMRIPPSIFIQGGVMPRIIGYSTGFGVIHTSTASEIGILATSKRRVTVHFVTQSSLANSVFISLDTLDSGAIFLSADL